MNVIENWNSSKIEKLLSKWKKYIEINDNFALIIIYWNFVFLSLFNEWQYDFSQQFNIFSASRSLFPNRTNILRVPYYQIWMSTIDDFNFTVIKNTECPNSIIQNNNSVLVFFGETRIQIPNRTNWSLVAWNLGHPIYSYLLLRLETAT